jgi:hypothetical protein
LRVVLLANTKVGETPPVGWLWYFDAMRIKPAYRRDVYDVRPDATPMAACRAGGFREILLIFTSAPLDLRCLGR